MIEKDPGNPCIKHLRVIHLFDTNYNLTLKLLWRKWLVHQREKNNCFSKQQLGSRPWHQVINVVHIKTLTYDLTRILRLSLVMFDNDATGCFDQIIVSLAMIAALWLGMLWLAARMHSSELLHMKYFIKIAHGSNLWRVLLCSEGLSSVWNRSREQAPPSVWLLTVMCLLTALKSWPQLQWCSLILRGYHWDMKCWLFCWWHASGLGNAVWGINCIWTGLCSYLGMPLVQLGRCTWAAKMLLVHGVFAMSEWMTQNGSHH